MKGYIADTWEGAVKRAYDYESTLPGATSRVQTGPWPRETRPEFLLVYKHTRTRANAVTGKWAAVIDDGAVLGQVLDAAWDVVLDIAGNVVVGAIADLGKLL